MSETADYVDFEGGTKKKSVDLKSRIQTGVLNGTKITDPTWYPWVASLFFLRIVFYLIIIMFKSSFYSNVTDLRYS